MSAPWFEDSSAAASTGGTVTSVAGGVGITGTPEPVVGAGTVDLDIFSLTAEVVSAAADWLPFVDVSVGTAPSAQRKVARADLLGDNLEDLRAFAGNGVLSLLAGPTFDISTGNAGTVAFWALNAQQLDGDDNLFWDVTNKTLVVGGQPTAVIAPIHLRSPGGVQWPAVVADGYFGGAGNVTPEFIARWARGTVAAESQALSGDVIGAFAGRAWFTGASDFSATKVRMAVRTAEDWTATAQGTRIGFDVTPVGSTTLTIDAVTIFSDGALSAIGAMHNFGTAGVDTYLFVGQGGGAATTAAGIINGGATGLASLQLQQDGANGLNIGVTTETFLDWYVGPLVIYSSGLEVARFVSTGELVLNDGPARQLTLANVGGGRSSLVDSSHAANLDYTLPAAITTSGYLKTTAGGALSWALVTAAEVASGAALTRVDDTNVTLALGGSPSAALLAATSLTLGWTGQLSISRGGTGAATALAAFNALSPLTTRGDLLTRDASNNVRKALGGAATYLRSDGTDPQWALGTANDDFTQYLLLAGRSGGQIARGGTAAGDTLDLRASAAANYTGTVHVGKGAGAFGANSAIFLTVAADNFSIAGTATSANALTFSPTITLTTSSFLGLLPLTSLFAAGPTLKGTSSAVTAYPAVTAILLTPTILNDTSAAVAASGVTALDARATLSNTSSGTLVATPVTAVSTQLVVSAGSTATDYRGLIFNDASGAGAVTNQVAVDVPALSKGGTLNCAVRSAVAAGANNYFLRDTGGAKSELAGKFTKYNNVATVLGGVPSEVANVDLTAQAAAIAATTLYAVPAAGAGLYRVSWVATVTTAATTSSVLGGAAGLQLKYTDSNDSVVKTENPTTPTISAGNTTATSVSGVEVAFCKASTNLQYLFGYTSVGVTAMQYNLHITVEAL